MTAARRDASEADAGGQIGWGPQHVAECHAPYGEFWRSDASRPVCHAVHGLRGGRSRTCARKGGRRSRPHAAAQRLRGQGARRLGGPDDRRLLRRADRVPIEREDQRGRRSTWRPDRVENAIDQDDLYVEMTFAEVMDRVGLDATTEQYGDDVPHSKYSLWHANAAARRLLNRGIKAPLSGHPKLQRPRQRHRLPDRVGLHRPDDAGAAAGSRTSTRTAWAG